MDPNSIAATQELTQIAQMIGTNPITDWMNTFVLTKPWLLLAFVVLRETATFIKNLRDAIDKTPETDDNWFERLATIIVKATKGYAVGIRPTASADTKVPLSGSTLKNAAGVKVEEKKP